MTSNPRPSQPQTWALLGILGVALALRLAWVLVIIPNPPLKGGDGPYYLDASRSLIGEGQLNWSSMLTIGPVYPAYLAIFFKLFGQERSVVQAARVGQAIMDTLTCLLAFDLGRRLFDARAGLVTAALLALDLRFIRQAGDISTETVFSFFLMASSWGFVLAREHNQPLGPRSVAAAGLGLLAAFTRAIALPLPILLTGALVLPKPTQKQVLGMAAIVGVVVLAVAGWSVRQYQLTGQWVIISEGFGGNFWMGSRGDGQWHGSIEFQNEINDLKTRYNGRLAYMEDAFKTIGASPVGYAKLLIVKGASAYLQPYGTFAFSGESLKDLAVELIRGELTLGQLVTGDSFWPKLYIYIFHFAGLIGGVLGLWFSRRQWLKVLPLSLPIVYISLAYLVLTIIPRYVFPIMPFYSVLAGYGFVAMFDALRRRKPPTEVTA